MHLNKDVLTVFARMAIDILTEQEVSHILRDMINRKEISVKVANQFLIDIKKIKNRKSYGNS